MMHDADPTITHLSEMGYAVLPNLLTKTQVDTLARLIEEARCGAGTRRLLNKAWCRELASQIALDPRIRSALPIDTQAVQCTLFLKDRETNWLVPLHQDLSVPVAGRVNGHHLKGWSEKEGETFVQPPTSVLNEILAVRVHLDDCDAENGALRVVPGSHSFGKLSTSETKRIREARTEVVVCVPRGGAMLLRPCFCTPRLRRYRPNPGEFFTLCTGPAHFRTTYVGRHGSRRRVMRISSLSSGSVR